MMDRDQVEEIVASSETAEEILTAMSECGSNNAAQSEAGKLTGLSSSSSEEDVYTALANRERDLMLAAELGKALLEKNEELQRKNEQLAEEYTQKIEELTQERHGLKLKLENLEAEYQATVRELQNDITLLQRALDERQQTSRNDTEKAHNYIVEELTAQNERLSEQLRQSAENERRLQGELRDLHEEMETRRLAMHEHVSRIDTLTNQEPESEMAEVCDKKDDLERRIESLLQERDGLVCSLEEAQERVTDLETQNKRQQNQLIDTEKNFQELQERNLQLQERLATPATASLTALEGSNTLFSELQMSGLAQAMSIESLDEPGAVKIGQQLRQEILEVYRQLNHMVMELKGTGDKWSPETIQIQDMKVGSLLTALKDLRDVVFTNVVKNSADKEDSQSLSQDLQDYLEHQDMKIQDLKRDVMEKVSEVTKVTDQLKVKEEQIKRYAQQVETSQRRISEQRSSIERLQQQLDKMADEKCDVTSDEILKQARSERDSALNQVRCMECEVEQAQKDVQDMDAQLMESIQQKLQLSQQLELWQGDMQDLIDKQVSKRMREERQAEEDRRLQRQKQQIQDKKSKAASPSKSRFSLFSRTPPSDVKK